MGVTSEVGLTSDRDLSVLTFLRNCSSNATNNLTSKKQKVCSLSLSATGTWKSEEEKNARGVTCFMEENVISLREVAKFDEYKRD